MATNQGAAKQPNGLCALLVKLNHLVHKIMLVIATLSIIAMIVIVTMTVVLRYCFNTGLSWAEEVPRLLVTVFAFMACAIGVRDHMHVSVDAIYNRFPVGGKARKFMDLLTDVVMLLIGVFMFWVGGQRTMKLFGLTGTLLMTFDSILFLTGVIKRNDLLYSEPEIDFTDEETIERIRKAGEAEAEREMKKGVEA